MSMRSSVIEDWTLEEEPAISSPSEVATTWGPPSPIDWPESPAVPMFHSPELALTVEHVPSKPTERLLSPPSSPMQSVQFLDGDEEAKTTSASDSLPEETRPVVWPFCDVPSFAAGSSRWANGGPHLYAEEQRPLAASQAYGFFDLYRAVYPHLRPYPPLACAGRDNPPPSHPLNKPDNSSFGWPYMKSTLHHEDWTPVGLATSLSLSMMPQSVTWPRAIDAFAQGWLFTQKSKSSSSATWSPSVDAFAQGWPYTQRPNKIPVLLDNHYPALTIYKPVYPHIEIYLSCIQSFSRPTSFSRVEYPHFDIYATVPSFQKVACRIPVALNLAIYPTIVVYPDVAQTSHAPTSIFPHSSSEYPWLVIYASVYPHIMPYPEAVPRMIPKPTFDMNVSLWNCYPYSAQRMYAPGYPDNLEIYPATSESWQLSHEEKAISIQTALQLRYPFMQIYAPQYPHFDIYPSVQHRVCNIADAPKLRILIGSKAPHPAVVAVQNHHHPTDTTHRHRHRSSSKDIPPVPPLPVDVLVKLKSTSSPNSPPQLISSTHVRINGTPQQALPSVASRSSSPLKTRKWKHSHQDLVRQVQEQQGLHLSSARQSSASSSPVNKKKWKHTHRDLVIQVFGSESQHHEVKTTTQILPPHEMSSEPVIRAGRPHSFYQAPRGCSGSVVGRPLSMAAHPTIPVGRLNLSKYPFA
ncbi:hypothetical protein DACRYDRAFT_21176 [Dacryopinax primogenitus]|uniref:Uncharacterized protein n=1 Tax=Dacryopinax primogenitus (strain DJM 731) TaxID=1858805 RepID=M5GEY2_DACPD|nr:uncharacterized protein DACRYDRAFT_21176 [Dacryopinax primogenitus]EJU03668.1 hypothetical protein DACRYDRAFT_21176 [Dacryopinax primogenitus]